ncbi:MAG: biotin--[acetyl-CoA-carboxylase] ligase [Alphaproteobacteria bacterium]|nr:biotin--[acetyl-CoA-carboxylase] ligase [Alphaproteobacteria bacterium]
MFDVLHFKVLDSTQTYALAHHHTFNQHTLIQADQQTQGRGYRGRTWHSQSGNFHATAVLKNLCIPLQYRGKLALVTAVAVGDYLQTLDVMEFGYKWPNDILGYDTVHKTYSKLSGILIHCFDDDVLIGCGINLTHAPTVEGYASICLQDLAPHAVERFSPHHFMECLIKTFDDFKLQGFETYRQAWLKRCVHINKPVTFYNTTHGVFRGIDAEGMAIMEHVL